jgi:hypothetical protein
MVSKRKKGHFVVFGRMGKYGVIRYWLSMGFSKAKKTVFN